jgi:parvulin-like peptidyl-prolyl isomerase
MASQTTDEIAAKKKKDAAEGSQKGGRNNTFVYVGTIIILIITVVAFVFVPSTGGGSSGKALTFGSYDGKSIEYAQNSYFAKMVQKYNDAMKQQGVNEQNYQLFAYQVYRQAFESTVTHVGIIDSVKKAGYVATDSYLDTKMAENAAFQENGKFSARLYREASMSSKLALRDELREDAYTGQYTDDIYSLSPSSKEVAFVKDMAKNTRSIEYAVLPLTNYPDSEVSAWAASNGQLFKRLKLSRISVAKQADAEKFLKEIKSDAKAFEEVAKANSTDAYASEGGAMGLRYFYEIKADLEKKEDAEKLAGLKQGEFSPVFKTLSGSYVFYRADAAAIQADLADAAVLKDARSYMIRYERGKLEDWVTAQAQAISSAPAASFNAEAKKLSLTVASAGPFPINYGDIDFAAYGQRIPLMQRVNAASAPELSQASTNDAFLTSVFSLAPGSVSKPMVLGDSVIVFKVKEAGASSDEEVSALSLYYPYFYQQKTSYEIGEVFLKSPLLKDNFMTVFFKYFQPKQS